MFRSRSSAPKANGRKGQDGRGPERSTVVYANVAACIWPITLVAFALFIVLWFGQASSISAAMGPFEFSVRPEPERNFPVPVAESAGRADDARIGKSESKIGQQR